MGKPLRTADLEVKVQPQVEWLQMYRDAWRIQREMFYDMGLHGANAADMGERYRRYLTRISLRSEPTYLMQKMMDELTVEHLNVANGERPEVKLRVGQNVDGTGAREVTMVSMGTEAGLRNLAWIEENRRKV